MAHDISVGLSLSLTGKYAAMGRQAAAATRLAIDEVNQSGGIEIDGARRPLVLRCIDDQSRIEDAREIYRALCFREPCGLILGPYASALVRAIVPIAEDAGYVLVNHGGADDTLHQRGYRGLVSVLSPASEYLIGFVRLLASLKFWRKRLAIVASQTPFATSISHGIEREAKQRWAWLHGVRVRLTYRGRLEDEEAARALLRAVRRNRINALVSAGSYDHDVRMMRFATAPPLNLPVLGCVAAGVDRFRRDLGESAEGIVGPSQWEPDFVNRPDFGRNSRQFARAVASECGACDYPAAQAYASIWLSAVALSKCGSLDQESLRRAFSDLRASTLFGEFAIEPRTGQQIAHRMLLVQWHQGHKEIIEADPTLAGGNLEVPSGWGLLFPATKLFKLNRRDAHVWDKDEEGE
jgi:branched-chain amino acid transport system substrate-binding protein